MFIARTVTAFTAAMLVAAPALASDPVKPAAQETPAAAVAKEKKYCAVVNNTGSRIAAKVCKTRDQWVKEEGFDPLAAK